MAKRRWIAVIGVAVLFSVGVPSLRAGQLQVDSYAFSVSHHEVSDIFFLNDSTGWIAVTDHGDANSYIFSTINGGEKWTRWKAPDGIFRIWFVNPSLGWALRQVGSGRGNEQVYLLRTKSGGQAWVEVSRVPISSQAQTAYSRASLAFLDGLHGWFVGSSALAPIFETSDGGMTIHQVENLPGRANVYHLCARRNQGVWIFGTGIVWHSTDLGKTWTSPVNLRALRTNPHAFDASDIDFSRDGQGWLVGDDPYGMILKTVDYGQHWKRVVEDQEIDTFSSVSFWDNSNGCATGPPAFLTCTRDGGITWSNRRLLPRARGSQSQWFSKLVMFKSGRGWALRLGGYLYSTVDGGQTWRRLDLLTPTSK